MTEERKQQIISILQNIYTSFEPTEEEPELTMFGLISRYNATGGNSELIGGDWVVTNCPAYLSKLNQ